MQRTLTVLKHFASRRAINAFMVALVTAAACNDRQITGVQTQNTDTASASRVAKGSVSVALASSSLQVAQTTQATAVTHDANGAALNRAPTWSSSNSSVATVSTTGLVTARSAGSASITATIQGVTGSANLTVQAGTSTGPNPTASVATVTVSLAASSVLAGGSTQASAVPRDASGNVLSGKTVSWTSSNSSVATVSAAGLVTAMAAGTSTITASSETKTGAAVVTVQPLVPITNPPAGSVAPEPGTGDAIIHQDNFDARTNFTGYAVGGAASLITGRGGSGQAARFSYSPSSDDNLIEKGFPAATDVYFRYYYRVSAGWFPYGGRTGSGMKWFMPWRADGSPRYTCGVGQLTSPNWQFTCHDNSSASQPNPVGQNKAAAPSFATTNDGQWHEYTLHIVTGNGGYEQIWIDGVLVLDDSGLGYDHSAVGISLVQFPGLVVDGIPDAAHSGTIDIDDFVIWHK